MLLFFSVLQSVITLECQLCWTFSLLLIESYMEDESMNDHCMIKCCHKKHSNLNWNHLLLTKQYLWCGVVCISMREDTHVNILPSPKGLVLEMEHERSGWTSWLELRRSGEGLWSWPVVFLPEDCWECCSSLGPARWGVLFSEARWSRREDLADSHLSLGFHVSRRSPGAFLCVHSKN
jgi:hypothetical protein